jgi:hypothetical protein
VQARHTHAPATTRGVESVKNEAVRNERVEAEMPVEHATCPDVRFECVSTVRVHCDNK